MTHSNIFSLVCIMEGKNKQVKISKCPFILYANLLFIITINFMQKDRGILTETIWNYFSFSRKRREKRYGCMKTLFYVQSEVQLHKLTQSNFLSHSK